jgi:hypothetical protein
MFACDKYNSIHIYAPCAGLQTMAYSALNQTVSFHGISTMKLSHHTLPQPSQIAVAGRQAGIGRVGVKPGVDL